MRHSCITEPVGPALAPEPAGAFRFKGRRLYDATIQPGPLGTTFGRFDAGRVAAKFTSHGFDAVELQCTLLATWPDKTREALRETGVPVTTTCAGFEGSLVHPEPAVCMRAIEDCRRLLDWAEELQANGLIIGADYGTPAAARLCCPST